jgi:glycosyltransferase involved in cell wall biosynthesis
MNIGIAAFHLFRFNKHGMDIAALELIKSISALQLPHSFFVFTINGPDNTILDGLPGIKVIRIPKVSYPVAEQIVLPLLLLYYRIHLLHCTSNTSPILVRKPIVTTLHDVIFLEYKLSHYRSMYHKMANLYRKIIVPVSIKRSSRVITVSNTEKKNIVAIINVAESNISVIPNAIARHFYANKESDPDPQIVLPERYIFFHGNTDPKKNMDGVLKAFAFLVDSKNIDYQLLLSEIDSKKLNQTLQRLNLLHIRSHVIPAGYIHNYQLPAVYRNAMVFLYPGIRESFGLPIIEAMACGTMVITSNISALPETAGDAALYINPLDFIQLANAIDTAVHDKELRTELIKKGIHQAQRYNREQTAHATLQVYESVLNRKVFSAKKKDKRVAASV